MTGKKLKLIIAGLLVLCLLVSMVTGTWALFSDTEASTGNTFTAGTLDLVSTLSGSYSGSATKYTVTAGGNGINGYVLFPSVIPGESGTITWVLSNTGSIGGTVTITSTCSYAENGSAEPESLVIGNDSGSNGDLDQYMGVKLTRNGTYILGNASYYVPISGLEAVLDAETNIALASGGSVTYILYWSLAADLRADNGGVFDGTGTDVNDNIIQSDTAQIDITFTLNQ